MPSFSFFFFHRHLLYFLYHAATFGEIHICETIYPPTSFRCRPSNIFSTVCSNSYLSWIPSEPDLRFRATGYGRWDVLGTGGAEGPRGLRGALHRPRWDARYETFWTKLVLLCTVFFPSRFIQWVRGWEIFVFLLQKIFILLVCIGLEKSISGIDFLI